MEIILLQIMVQVVEVVQTAQDQEEVALLEELVVLVE
jgi:hypothetical protein